MRPEAKREGRVRRHERLRKRLKGNGERPRLAVFRSNKYIYAQVIDDAKGVTLAFAGTLEKELKAKFQGKVNKAAAAEVGKLVAARAKAAGVKLVVFDRGGFMYHGRVKELAEAARAGGLEF